jgi:DNA (cytosine-5)-methyltransferase 3A
MGINVLSLFDGMSCGQIALERAGVKVDNYFASEIKPHAIKVTQHNYPKTIQLGDVTKITKDMLPHINMVIGGSPCQDFSAANSNKLGLQGEKSKLFFEYVRILNELKQTYFLLENVVMDFMSMSFITDTLNSHPIRINSSLVSAQNRDRLYWTNIGPNDTDLFGKHICNIPLPVDKGIQLKDILENGYSDMDKSRALLSEDSRPLATPTKMFHRYNDTGFTTCVFKDEEAYKDMLHAHTKAQINQINQINQIKEFGDSPHENNRIYSDVGKINTLTATHAHGGMIFSKDKIRYLTQTELERLQTVPQGYTKPLNRNQAADCLGDGWTVDVIAHIFSFLPKEYKL